MICADCIFAYTDPNDNQDIYSCDCGYNNNSNPQDYCMY